MAEPDDDPIASWQNRISTLRKRGRVSGAALAVVPAEETDVRRARAPAPDRLSEAERELWERLVYSRRPGWFLGAETLLESFVVATIQCQGLEAALRKAKPSTSDRYARLTRMHRQVVALAATLATRLRLTPHEASQKPADGWRATCGLICTGNTPFGGSTLPSVANTGTNMPDKQIGRANF